jgi:hypothetical protein
MDPSPPAAAGTRHREPRSNPRPSTSPGGSPTRSGTCSLATSSSLPEVPLFVWRPDRPLWNCARERIIQFRLIHPPRWPQRHEHRSTSLPTRGPRPRTTDHQLTSSPSSWRRTASAMPWPPARYRNARKVAVSRVKLRRLPGTTNARLDRPPPDARFGFTKRELTTRKPGRSEVVRGRSPGVGSRHARLHPKA